MNKSVQIPPYKITFLCKLCPVGVKKQVWKSAKSATILIHKTESKHSISCRKYLRVNDDHKKSLTKCNTVSKLPNNLHAFFLTRSNLDLHYVSCKWSCVTLLKATHVNKWRVCLSSAEWRDRTLRFYIWHFLRAHAEDLPSHRHRGTLQEDVSHVFLFLFIYIYIYINLPAPFFVIVSLFFNLKMNNRRW